MSEQIFNTRIVNKHDIEANWKEAHEFIPKQGELIVYDIDENHSYSRIKMGDGITNINSLPFITEAIEIDATLTQKGVAADAEAVGKAFEILSNQMGDLLYKTIAITSFTNDKNTQEIGSTISNVKLTWSTNKAPKTLILDGVTLDTKLTTYTYENLNIKNNTSYKLTVTDERDAKAEKTTSISFVNGVYYGVISKDQSLNSESILSLTRELQTTKALSFSTIANEGQYIVYALPSRYGVPSFNVGGFDGGFHLKETVQFTNSSGYTEAYDVYYSDNIALGETTVKVS